MNVRQREDCTQLEKILLEYPSFLEEYEDWVDSGLVTTLQYCEEITSVAQVMEEALSMAISKKSGPIIGLKYFEDLTDEEVSEMMGCDPRTARRKRKLLLDEMEEYLVNTYGTDILDEITTSLHRPHLFIPSSPISQK